MRRGPTSIGKGGTLHRSELITRLSLNCRRCPIVLSLFSYIISGTIVHADTIEGNFEKADVLQQEKLQSKHDKIKQDQSKQEQDLQQQECEESVENDNTPKWSKPLIDGPEQMFFFVQAVSGKKLKPSTQDLLKGVTGVDIEADRIVFKRVDNEELPISAGTTGGAKFYNDWEKSKVNLEAKFGVQGKEFLENIEGVHLNGERIEVVRKGPEELVVDLGERKLHQTFDLRSLRFRQISMLVDRTGDFPKLTDINGVTAIIKAPGFSFPVEVKEFGKIRLKKENDITVGVTNPVPGALRALLFMPPIFRFHFRLARKE